MQSRIFRITVVAILLSLLVLSGASAGGNREDSAEEQAQQGEPIEDAAATVNGVTVPMTRYNEEVERTELQMRRQAQGQEISEEQLEQMKTDILESLITTELLYAEASDAGISIEDSAVDQQVQQLKDQSGGEEGFQQNLEEFQLTEEQLRTDLRKNLAIQELLQQEVVDQIEVTEQEQREFYDENPDMFARPPAVTARHILISTQQAETEEAQQAAQAEAEDLLQQIEDGADFAELATEHSDDPGSASNGGLLPEFTQGRMVPPFEQAAFSLEPGEVSDVVQTRFGYHIIKVEEKSGGDSIPFDEIQAQLGPYLRQQKQDTEIRSYIDDLKADAEIERFVESG